MNTMTNTTRIIVSILFIAMLLAGCNTKTVVVTETVCDSIGIVKEVHDSIFESDSVYLHEYQKGDTVVKEKVKTVYRYRSRQKTDTVNVSHIEMTPVYVDVERQVPASLTFGQRIKLKIADGLIFAIVGIGLAIMVYAYLKR